MIKFLFILLFFLFLNLREVLSIDCQPASFRFTVFESNISYDETYIYKIGNDKEIPCAVDATYKWFIFDLNSSQDVTREVVKSDNIANPKLETLQLSFLNVNEPFGNSYNMTVALVSNGQIGGTIERTLTVRPDVYTLEIEGGRERIHQLSDGNLKLSLTASRASGKPIKHTNIIWSCSPKLQGGPPRSSYTWEIDRRTLLAHQRYTCSATMVLESGLEEKATQLITVAPEPDWTLLEIICIDNCLEEHSFASKDTRLNYACYGFCKGNVIWTLDPINNEIQSKFKYLSNTNESILVPRNTFEHGLTYRIVVEMNHKMARYSLTFKIPERNLEINCIKNCFDSQKEIILQGNCSGDCYGVKYFWYVVPFPDNWIDTIKGYVTTNDKIKFKPNTFPPNMGASVVVNTLNKSAILNFTVDELVPKMDIFCETCHNPDPNIDHHFDAHCVENCLNLRKYNWQLDPLPLKTLVKKNSRFLMIPKGSYKFGTLLNVSLFMNDKKESTSLLLHLQLPDQLEIVCLRNCGPLDNLALYNLPTVMRVECKGHCKESNYIWSLYPTSSDVDANFRVYDDNKQFMIPEYYYKGQVPFSNVTVELHGIISSKIVNYRNREPQISIICISNCLKLTDPLRDAVFQAHCIEDCVNIQYYWELHPTNFSNFWHDRVILSSTNSTITLKNQMFPRGVPFDLVLKSKPLNGTTKVELMYDFEKPELIIECYANCDSSIHKNLILIAKCVSNCVDPMNYTWKYTPAPDNPKGKVFLKDKTSTLIMTSPAYTSDRDVRFTVEAEGVMAILVIHFKREFPNLNITCHPKPCSKFQNALENVNIIATCISTCEDHEIQWELQPDPLQWGKQIIQHPNHRKLTILAKTFEKDEDVTLKVTIKPDFWEFPLKFRIPKPIFYVKCVDNCNTSDPFLEVHLKIKCEWNCHYVDTYQWTFDPVSPDKQHDIRMNPGQTQATILKKSYKDGDRVVATASWRGYVNGEIISFEERAPELLIRCLENCEYIVTKRTIFEVICVSNCSAVEWFNWTMDPVATNVKYYNKGNAIEFLPRAYETDEFVKLTVCARKGCKIKFIAFVNPKYKLRLDCIKNCDENFVAVPSMPTAIKVVCLENCMMSMVYKWNLDETYTDLIENQDYGFGASGDFLWLRAHLFLNETLFYVQVTSDTVSVHEHIHFLQPTPVVRLICHENCGYSDPSQQVIYSITCFKKCYNLIYDWKLYSEYALTRNNSKQFFLVLNSKAILIIPNIFKDEDTVAIRVYIGSFFVEKSVRFAEKPPNLIIKCKPNCTGIDPNQNITLNIECVKPCHPTHYVWQISPTPTGFLWGLNTTTSSDNKTLTIVGGTYIGGSVVNLRVDGQDRSLGTIEISYGTLETKLFLKCESNCEFYLDSIVVINLSCQGYCFYLEDQLNCTVTPSRSFSYFKSTFHIKSFEFHQGDIVTINCKFREATADYLLVFKPTLWSGTCAIRPLLGLSGITEHTIDCVGFKVGVIFELFQPLPDSTNNIDGVKFYRGYYNYIPNIWLAPGLTLKLVVTTGLGWSIYKKIDLFVLSISPYTSHRPRQTFLSFYQYIKNKKAVHNDLEQKLKIFNDLTSIGRFQKAYQMAFIIERILKTLPARTDLYYRQYIAIGLQKMTNDIEPTQLLSFVAVLVSSKRYTLEILLNNLNVTVTAAQRFALWNEGYDKMDHRVKKHVGKVLLTIAVKTISKGILPNYKNFIGVEQLLDENFSMKEILHRLIKLTLQVLEIGMQLLGFKEELRYMEEDFFSMVVLRTTTSKSQTIPLKLTENGSYVEFIPLAFFPRKKIPITFKFAVFNYDFFGREMTRKSQSQSVEFGEIAYFSPSSKDFTRFKGFYRIFIKLHTNKRYQEIDIILDNSSFVVYKFLPPINTSVEIYATGDAKITMSIAKPDKNFIEKKGRELKFSEKIHFIVTKSPFYVGVLGNGPIAIGFVGLICTAWSGKFTQNHYDGCWVSFKQPYKDYISCDCSAMPIVTAGFLNIPYELEEKTSNSFQSKLVIPYSNMIAICVLLFAFIFIMVISMKRDIKSKKHLISLFENKEEDKELYIVAVQTGMWRNSGTSARVAIKLFGLRHSSKIHLLNILQEKVLQRNSADCFIIKTQTSLGEIKYIQLWHDSSGDKPHWFCESICVHHVQSGKRYFFAIFRWFSLIFPPFTINGIFKPIIKRRQVGLKAKYLSSARLKHFNLSFLIGRRIDSNYTRKAAISITSILTMMAVGAVNINEFDNVMMQILKIVFCVSAGSFTTIILDFLYTNTP